MTVYYSLGKLTNKHSLVELFIIGLDDVSAKVVHSALQALAGIRDERLRTAYCRVSERFKTDENYVLTNLKHRLKEMDAVNSRLRQIPDEAIRIDQGRHA